MPNPLLGHPTRALPILLMELSGPSDRGARYGGDEFVLILPGRGKQGALRMAEKIRDAIGKAVFFKDEGFNIKVTASFGVAVFPDDADDYTSLLSLADQSMFNAKNSGKDHVRSNPTALSEETIGP